MAIVTAKYSFSFDAMNFLSLPFADKYTTQSDLYVVDFGDSEVRLTGSNLRYDSAGMLKSGSVTGYQVASDEDGTVLTITGLSISASKIADAAATVTNLHDDRAVIKQFFAGADQIAGSRYVDQLNGFAGNDVINGGLGRDILTGGAGADIFVFTKGSGADVITDFNANNSSASHDLIDLSVYQGIDDFSDLSVHKAAGDVVLDLGADRIILNDVKVASIDAGDFSF